MSFSAANCIFFRALEIPYLHLEDVFIVAFAGQACQVQIFDDGNFHFMGLKNKTKDISKWDVLFHYTKKFEFENKFRKKISTFDYQTGKC